MKIIISLLLLVSLESMAQSLSLQESIEMAFEKNPITQANDLRLEAAKYRARGAKLDMLPGASVSCSKSISNFQTRVGEFSESNRSFSQGCNVGININLFDGFADLNTARAAQKDVEALEARNNSTNNLNPDTRGSLASEVFDVYRWAVEMKEYIAANEKSRERLEILLKAAKTEDQKNEIMAKLANNNNGAYSLKDSIESAANEYKYVVKMPLPPRIDTFEQIANSLELPETVDEAVSIALVKNPDIIDYEKTLEGARLRRKAEKGRTFSPKVNLGIDYGHSRFDGEGPASSSRGTSAYLTVSIPLGVSKFAYSKASALELQATEKDLDKILERAEFRVRKLYRALHTQSELSQRYKQALHKTDEDVEEVIKKAQANEDFDMRYAFSLMGEYGNLVHQYVMNERELIGTKFEIQKTLGILFESVDTVNFR